MTRRFFLQNAATVGAVAAPLAFYALFAPCAADDAALEDSDSFTRPPSSSQCSEAVDICVELASRIKPAKKGLAQGEADLAAIRQMCKV